MNYRVLGIISELLSVEMTVCCIIEYKDEKCLR